MSATPVTDNGRINIPFSHSKNINSKGDKVPLERVI